VGTDWIGAMFPGADVQAMDAAAAGRLPSEGVAYPLVRAGERFPFLAADAHGFFVPEFSDRADRYAACLQGVALVERLGYQVLDAAAGDCPDFRLSENGTVPFAPGAGEVYGTGGGSRSDVWMQCRADATGRVIHRPACGESAFGAAVLSAAGAHYNSIVEAVARMVRLERTFTPDRQRAAVCDRLFVRFCGELRKRGYL